MASTDLETILTKSDAVDDVPAALEALRGYAGRTVVIKYGGAAMTDDALKQAFARDIVALSNLGVRIVVVHGGGKDVTATAEKLGIETKFVHGQRYTSAEMIPVVLMVLAGSLNKQIVAMINADGGHAAGLCGVDNVLFRTRRLINRGVDMGLVGEVVEVNATFLNALFDAGVVPVVAPAGLADNGEVHNVNADVAAAAVARALEADRLLFLSDIPGIMENSKLVASLDPAGARDLIEREVISGGMIPKVDSALEALDSGVGEVHIIDGRVPHALLIDLAAVGRSVGTRIGKESSAV